MGNIEWKYPKFLIFELRIEGPLVTQFETADDVADYLPGKHLLKLALFVNGEIFVFKSEDIDTIRERLKRLESAD